MRAVDGTSANAPVGVISAVLLDASRPGRVLLGVRRPSPLASRHPNVLSTPTLRLPADLFGVLASGYPKLQEPCIRTVDGAEIDVGRGGHVATVDAFALEALLARKLDLAEAIVAGDFYAVARCRFLSLEDVGDPLGTAQREWTAMLTYQVQVRHGVEALPQETASYSRFVWADAARLPQAVAHHDALLLDETLSAVEVCVQGLCVRVAVELVKTLPLPAGSLLNRRSEPVSFDNSVSATLPAHTR